MASEMALSQCSRIPAHLVEPLPLLVPHRMAYHVSLLPLRVIACDNLDV